MSTLFFAACGQSKENTQGQAVAYSRTTAAQDKQELKEAPNFSLEKMNGETFTLKEHKGKVIVLNIWATWCPPCRKEIPDFIELQKNMRDEGVLFVGVAMDKEGWEVVQPFAEKYEINYPIMVDDGSVYSKYGPYRGIPTTFIINKKGKVEFVALGLIGKNALKSTLKKLTND
ncbi:MAG TPA: TlpA disulfide reductase family protein [Balneolaceae bacterium]|nr:TlpA disulfide reductase family protein [Balneolaceae bacterium]